MPTLDTATKFAGAFNAKDGAALVALMDDAIVLDGPFPLGHHEGSAAVSETLLGIAALGLQLGSPVEDGGTTLSTVQTPGGQMNFVYTAPNGKVSRIDVLPPTGSEPEPEPSVTRSAGERKMYAPRQVPVDRPIPVTLSHVVLRTAHLDATIEFYDKLLGMKTISRGERGAALSHDGEHHRIALASVPPVDDADPIAPGLEHLAYKVRSLPEHLGNYRRLKKIGITPFRTLHHGGTLSAYYYDPDGVQVELFVDTQVADLSIEMMNHSETFKKNPIGVPVDFDDLADRYEAGESIDSLLAQPPLKEGQLEELVKQVMADRMVKASSVVR